MLEFQQCSKILDKPTLFQQSIFEVISVKSARVLKLACVEALWQLWQLSSHLGRALGQHGSWAAYKSVIYTVDHFFWTLSLKSKTASRAIETMHRLKI